MITWQQLGEDQTIQTYKVNTPSNNHVPLVEKNRLIGRT